MATVNLAASENGKQHEVTVEEAIIGLCQKYGVKDILLLGCADDGPFMVQVGDEMLLLTVATKNLNRIAKERADRLGRFADAPLRRTCVSFST